ncbi:unnamed protein product [Pleuronectes platessa]|uniref:Uncharacterized protein n=1 Tax=Pleuronectes platessa TaxID=8262 RepID=A0A9N7VW09_PLEPL|nr:unnamed protein product [Pleuronectes platessa]
MFSDVVNQRLSVVPDDEATHWEHAARPNTDAGWNAGVQMGGGTLRCSTFLRKLEPGGTLFQTRVVCGCHVRRGRGTNCRQAAASRHQRESGLRRKVTPRSSVAQSVTLSSPGPPRSQPLCRTSSQRTGARALTFPTSRITQTGSHGGTCWMSEGHTQPHCGV